MIEVGKLNQKLAYKFYLEVLMPKKLIKLYTFCTFIKKSAFRQFLVKRGYLNPILCLIVNVGNVIFCLKLPHYYLVVYNVNTKLFVQLVEFFQAGSVY